MLKLTPSLIDRTTHVHTCALCRALKMLGSDEIGTFCFTPNGPWASTGVKAP